MIEGWKSGTKLIPVKMEIDGVSVAIEYQQLEVIHVCLSMANDGCRHPQRSEARHHDRSVDPDGAHQSRGHSESGVHHAYCDQQSTGAAGSGHRPRCLGLLLDRRRGRADAGMRGNSEYALVGFGMCTAVCAAVCVLDAHLLRADDRSTNNFDFGERSCWMSSRLRSTTFIRRSARTAA